MNVFFVSMGCAKNTADSERLMGRLASLGHRIVEDPLEAEVGIINTCGFIQDAVKENVDAILDLEQMKERGILPRIIVAGCLVNRYEAELRQELPSVDLFVRAGDWDAVADYLSSSLTQPSGMADISTHWSRYLKISEGCDTRCSYCTIPMIRGPLQSTPVEALVEEALRFCEAGAKELCLVGQDLTVYGRDLYGEPSLARLVGELDRNLPKGTWLRLLYLHPDRVTEGLIRFLMEREKVLRYLDIPIQHVDDAILLRMNRGAGGEHIRGVFRSIREKDPLFTLRTTLMTGFPGETEEQFQKALDFLEECELDHVGTFPYSPEEGTPAASFSGAVPHEVAEERCGRLMELQARISRERGELFIGRELEVLVEEIDEEAGEAWGRSYRDAPEVDGMVFVDLKGSRNVSPGDFIRARVDDCEEHDLFGTILEEGQ